MYPIVIQQPTNYWAIIITVLTTLVAAFGGAWFAFLLQNRKEKKKETNKNIEALNKVQITLTQQLNALTILNKDLIQPHKDHPIKWLAMPAVSHRNYSKLQIDAGSLSFLVEKGSSSLISEVLNVEEKFKEVMNIVNLRSNFHVQKLQPKLAEIGIEEGKTYQLQPEKVEHLLGIQIVGTLKKFTDSLIQITEDAITSHEKIINDIKTIGKKIFPKSKIVSFSYINKKEKYNQANTADAKTPLS